MKVKQFKHRKSAPVHWASSSAKPRFTESSPTAVITAVQQLDAAATQDMPMEHALQPIPSKVMFWRPRYLANSQWLQHIPFYFWLTDVLQPKVVVEPNLNSAVGYFAICQAIDKLDQDGLVYGAFGKQCNIEQVSGYNHEHYREFSQLTASDESTFVSHFDDASIDLLMLKQGSPLLIDESGQTGLSPVLQRKLSPYAVVLIHGCMLSEHRKMCAALRNLYPSFELPQQNGLLLLCIGKQIPSQLEALIHQGKDTSIQRVIQNIYARLGNANEDAWQCTIYKQQVNELTEQLQKQTHHIQHIQAAKQTLTDKLQQAIENVATAENHQAELIAKLAALSDENNDNCEQKHRLEEEKTQLHQEITKLKQSNKQTVAEQARLQQDIDVRFDELAKLTQLLVDTENRLDAAQQDNQALRQQLGEKQELLEKSNASAKQSLAKAQSDFTHLQGELTRTQAALSDAQHAQAQTQAKITHLQAEKDQEQREKNQVQTELAAVIAELSATQAQLQKQRELSALLERDQQIAADKISTLVGSELSLQQSLNERFDELATLTNLLQQKERQYEAELNELKAAQQQFNEQQHSAITDKIKGKIGAAKQRRSKAKQFALNVDVIRQSELFDEVWYLNQYPEAVNHQQGAAGHYLENGLELKANPSTAFDGNWYLSTYQDVKDAGINPLFHYLKFGTQESRLYQSIKFQTK